MGIGVPNRDPKIDQNGDPKSTKMGTQNGGPEMCDSGYFVTVANVVKLWITNLIFVLLFSN